MKKVLITGAGGFTCSHFTELFVKEGFKVKAFVWFNTRNNWESLECSEVKNDVEVVVEDIKDCDSVFNCLKRYSSVFHLASLIGIPYSYVSPNAYMHRFH